jgi:hypothetical protein
MNGAAATRPHVGRHLRVPTRLVKATPIHLLYNPGETMKYVYFPIRGCIRSWLF